MKAFLIGSAIVVIAFFVGLANGHSHARVDHTVGKTVVIKVPGPTVHQTKVVAAPMPASCNKVLGDIADVYSVLAKSDGPVTSANDQLDNLAGSKVEHYSFAEITGIQAKLTTYARQISSNDGYYQQRIEGVQTDMSQCKADS